MTYLHLIKTNRADPGHLPDWLKTTSQPNSLTPDELVRLYNMRSFESNKIYSFDDLHARNTIEDVTGDENSCAEPLNTTTCS